MLQLRREGCGAWIQGMASAMAKIVLMEMDLYACIHDRLSFWKGIIDLPFPVLLGGGYTQCMSRYTPTHFYTHGYHTHDVFIYIYIYTCSIQFHVKIPIEPHQLDCFSRYFSCLARASALLTLWQESRARCDGPVTWCIMLIVRGSASFPA